jgi:transcription antitermination factor NusG
MMKTLLAMLTLALGVFFTSPAVAYEEGDMVDIQSGCFDIYAARKIAKAVQIEDKFVARVETKMLITQLLAEGKCGSLGRNWNLLVDVIVDTFIDFDGDVVQLAQLSFIDDNKKVWYVWAFLVDPTLQGLKV